MFFLIVFLVFVYFLFTHFLEKWELSDLENKPVFITGCDSGFGHGLALKCLSRGMPVFAGCLTEKGADELKKEARNLSGKLETILINVVDDQSVLKAKEKLEEKVKPYGGLHGLVNNAGIVGAAFVDDLLTVDDYKRTAEVNVWGIIRVTHAMKDIIKRLRGRIVVVTSICARISIPANGPYTVAKHAASGYCDTIRKELSPWGVKVCVLEPGFFNTPLTDYRNVVGIIESVWKKTSPEMKKAYGEEYLHESQRSAQQFLIRIGSDRTDLVVDAYFHALTAMFPRPRYQVGNDSKFFWGPASLLPSRLQDLLFYLGDLLLGRPIPAALKTRK